MQYVARKTMRISNLPFPYSALIGSQPDPDLNRFLGYVLKGSNIVHELEKQSLIVENLKKNPPSREHYNNPLVFFNKELCNSIFWIGIDLPGSVLNPIGMGYFNNLFIDAFFGNISEVIDHIEGLSPEELEKALLRREGYCQFSLLFAPIVGLRVFDIPDDPFYTSKAKAEFKLMYSGNNKNKHLEILEKLLELGADPNAHDNGGYTPLHHLLQFSNPAVAGVRKDMAELLLHQGANPNVECVTGDRLMDIFVKSPNPEILEVLIGHGAKPRNNKETADALRTIIELTASVDVAARFRHICPRRVNECERCGICSQTKCSGCKLVFYCSRVCQKMDWKFHKLRCDMRGEK